MSERRDGDSVLVYSDYVCPFCYLGRYSLNRYRDACDVPPPIDWHPFDLRAHQRDDDGTIDPAIDDGKSEAYFEQARRNVRRLRDRFGVEMAGDLFRDVDSRNAQIVSFHVKTESPARWESFHNAIFDGLWKNGRDIGDPNVLSDIAESVGIDGDRVRSIIRNGETDPIDRKFEEARQAGITGVPTFVYRNRSISGAVPPAQLERLVEGAR